ncbi:MAG: ribonuclease P protein component [Schleiferiaceae bacterium]
MGFSFPKSTKLTSEILIDKLFAEGKSTNASGLRCVFLPVDLPAEVPFQFLFSAPKRNFKKAVDRNRIKRQLKEVVRLHPEFLEALGGQSYAIAILFTGRRKPTYAELEKAYRQCTEKFVHSIGATKS